MMKNEKLLYAIGNIHEKYIEEAATELETPSSTMTTTSSKSAIVTPKQPRWRRLLLITSAIILCLGITSVVAATSMKIDLIEFLKSITRQDFDILQEQLTAGEWLYLNDENIAVIVPESPTKVLLSNDGGQTWRKSSVLGSDIGFHNGSLRKNIHYSGGYIGFSNDKNGYLLLTTGVTLGSQDTRIFLTTDGGETWEEIGNLNETHRFVVTGAGFSALEVGFISYRYYEDAGPDIWWSKNRGDTWERLTINIPQQYQKEHYRFTPLSPIFDGLHGVYPIIVHDYSTDPSAQTTIYMYSNDGGMSWNFD